MIYFVEHFGVTSIPLTESRRFRVLEWQHQGLGHFRERDAYVHALGGDKQGNPQWLYRDGRHA
jgi:hypothetical protein